MENLLGD
jgi:hypothetical protein